MDDGVAGTSRRPQPHARRFRIARWADALAVAACVLCSTPIAHAQLIDPGKAAKVKAAYLLNFIRYTSWPESSFESPTSPIVLTIVGGCDVSDTLSEAVARSEPVAGRTLMLAHARLPRGRPVDEDFVSELRRSHIVYMCALAPQQARAILERLDGHVLTVGDIPHFAQNGGMLGFVLRGDRIVFEANTAAIQTTQVAVSGKVLKLAQIVEGRASP